MTQEQILWATGVWAIMVIALEEYRAVVAIAEERLKVVVALVKEHA